MNDDKLITAVREPFTDVHMNTPVEQIVSRGRAVRARRRIPGAAGALAVVAAVAVAVTALLPAGHQEGARLASWSVTRQSDGAIKVTFWQLTDPAGLQRKLRADGLPASVSFLDRQNPACRVYPSGRPLIDRVISSASNGRGDTIWIIHPSLLPRGAGVELSAGRLPPPPRGEVGIPVYSGLVRTSAACTGS